jgi:hypothetical protein
MNAPGLAGSGAAISVSFAASSAWTSSFATEADLDSWEAAVVTDSAAAHKAPAARTTQGRPKNAMVDLTWKM